MYKHGFPRDWSTLKKLIWLQGSPAMGKNLPWSEFTGNPLQFTAPKAHTLKSATVEFSPKQSGTGDPSPDNVRPISGWDGVSVWNETDYDPTAQPMTTLTFPSTVYGATGDVVSGDWAENKSLFTFGADDVDNWTQSSAGTHYFTRRRPTGFTQTTEAAWELGFSSNYLGNPSRSTSASSVKDNGYYAGSSYLVCRADTIADIDAWKAFISATPLQICVPLGESSQIPFTTTPTDVTAIKGINTMWTDGSNLTVEARGEAVNNA